MFGYDSDLPRRRLEEELLIAERAYRERESEEPENIECDRYLDWEDDMETLKAKIQDIKNQLCQF